MSLEQKNTPLRVTFFGDSICVGQGVSIHSGWVTRVAGRLEDVAKLHVREVVVTNASVNGNTTRQALERMPYDVQSHGVDILIIQFGMNDCNYWQTDGGLPRVSRPVFAANLREIIQRARTFGAKRIFLHNNHPTTRDNECFPNTSISYQESSHEYNKVIRDLAAQIGDWVEFTDIEAAFVNYTGGDRSRLEALLQSDGLHLSRQGHDLYFGLVSDKIEQCVSEALAGRY